MSEHNDARRTSRETSPLLPREADEPATANPHKGVSLTIKAKVIGLLAFILVVYIVGIAIFVIPVNTLLNRHFCEKLFPDDQRDCQADKGRADVVSAAYATFDGWTNVINILPSLIFSIPYGLLADKIGRKKTFFLNLVGLSLFVLYSLAVSMYIHALYLFTRIFYLPYSSLQLGSR